MISNIRTWNINNRRVFLRVDLNVPITNGVISNDFRLLSILPTLDYLLSKNSMVVLATQRGKPNHRDESLSTHILIPWFKKRGYTISYAAHPSHIVRVKIIPKHIILLENLRFFEGEQTGDLLFAKQLAQTAEYYVNDAFATMHRYDTSISLLPYEFPENRRSIGFLVEKELHALSQLKHPKKPYIAFLGGKKIADKIPLITGLISIADTIVLCPALCFSFLAAQGYPIGQSLIDSNTFSTCRQILTLAEDNKVSIIFPIDYQIADKTTDGPLSYCDALNFPTDAFGIAIGPKTVTLLSHYISHAHTIFFNGAMGFSEQPETRQTTTELLQLIADAQGKSIIAGGDTSEVVYSAQLQDKVDFLSTGGGAALAYISRKELPGLLPFEEIIDH
jgi:3-phosphoglycerate kinase